MRNILTAALALFVLTATIACKPAIAVSRAVEIESISAAWSQFPGDNNTHTGSTKVVPWIAFRLKNVTNERLVSLQANAVFHRAGEDGEWGSAFATVAGTQGLAPGHNSNDVILMSQLGYTGTESAAELLENSAFVDVSVDIYVKYAAAQWTRVAQVPIARRLVWDINKRN